jgi:hypothetical protein
VRTGSGATRDPEPCCPRGERLVASKLAILVLTILLAGCARTRTVYLIGRGQAPSGQTTISATAIQQEADIQLPMAGEIYSGRVNYVVRAGDASIAPGISIGVDKVRDVSGTILSGPMEAAGTIEMATPGGAWLHCWFSFNPRASFGLGECGDERNRRYDLQINTGP